MAELTASLEQLRGARADRRTGGGSSGGFSFDEIGNLLDRDKRDARSKSPDVSDILDGFSRETSGVASRSGPRGGLSGLLDRIFARKRDR
jgi:hypothetical protein